MQSFCMMLRTDLPISTIDVITNSMESIVVNEYMVYSINVSMKIAYFQMLKHQKTQFSSTSFQVHA